MKFALKSVLAIFVMSVFCIFVNQPTQGAASAGEINMDVPPSVCKPDLAAASDVEMGNSGIFSWKCGESVGKGAGFYVVFIRPSGTYILLKVPIGKNSFEFTPDTIGVWRWMVINTDPDRSRPDVESEPGHFRVVDVQQ